MDLVGRTVGDRVQPRGYDPHPARATGPQYQGLTGGDPQSAVSQNTSARPSRSDATSGSWINTPRHGQSTCPVSTTKGALEPSGHAVGRSRGGLSSKLHAAVDGNGMPIAIVLTGGQRNDGAVFAEVLDDIRVPRLGPGRPRTRPDAVIADKAYSNGLIRKMLSDRNIRAVVPQKSNEKAARKRKGSAGGRPPGLDEMVYKRRNVVERQFNLAKQWRGIATRYDKLAITYRATVVLCAVIAWLRKSDTP